jgi:hypothetical protein
MPGLQADSPWSELKSFCRPAEGRVFCRLRPIAGSLQTAPLAYGCLPARWQRSRSAGASPISVRKPRGRPRPLRDTASPIAPRPVSSPRSAAFEAAARCPSRAAWAVAIARGHRGGCRFHRKQASTLNRAGLPLIVPCAGGCELRQDARFPWGAALWRVGRGGLLVCQVVTGWAGVSPWRRIASASAARSGGPPAAAARTWATSLK